MVTAASARSGSDLSAPAIDGASDTSRSTSECRQRVSPADREDRVPDIAGTVLGHLPTEIVEDLPGPRRIAADVRPRPLDPLRGAGLERRLDEVDLVVAANIAFLRMGLDEQVACDRGDERSESNDLGLQGRADRQPRQPEAPSVDPLDLVELQGRPRGAGGHRLKLIAPVGRTGPARGALPARSQQIDGS